MSRGVNLAVRVRVNASDIVPWSTTSGSVSRGVTLAVRDLVNVGDRVPWTATYG